MNNSSEDRIIQAFHQKIQEINTKEYQANVIESKYKKKKRKGIFKVTVITDIFRPQKFIFGFQIDMKEKMREDNLSINEYYDKEGIITYQDMTWEEYIDFSFCVNGITYYSREDI